jgi:hypothetical protein
MCFFVLFINLNVPFILEYMLCDHVLMLVRQISILFSVTLIRFYRLKHFFFKYCSKKNTHNNTAL